MQEEALSILIADDDDGDRKQIKRVIKQAGIFCDIVEALDMETALEACDEQLFDFAILDYQMPGHNGLEGVTLLHEKAPYTAIIMVTGQGDEMIASEAIKRGASDYIPKKSISTDSLSRIIERSLERTALCRRLDEQREALESFSYILAHDLAEPLRHIRAFSKLIGQSIDDEEYEKIPGYFSFIDNASTRMHDMIYSLNQYNKIGGMDIEFTVVSMQKITEEAIDNLSEVIKEKNAQITIGVLPELKGNTPQLIQLMQNLIANGIKYSVEEIPCIHVAAQEQHNRQCITVKDNGIGIPASFYQAVFNPFRRLHTSGNKEFPGTGLGLTTCKKIIERHKGSIWCDSKQDQGTTFYFTLFS